MHVDYKIYVFPMSFFANIFLWSFILLLQWNFIGCIASICECNVEDFDQKANYID